MKPGIYPNLSSEDYHNHKESISRSALMDFDKSAYTYWAKHLNPDRPKKDVTQAMGLGSAFHTLILEPEKWGDIYSVMPEKKLLRDVGREEYDANEDRIEAVKQNLGRHIILNFKDYLTLIEMEKSLKKKKIAWDLIKGARIEHSFFWIDPHSRLLVKCRPDILHSNMIVDLKSCSDASPRAYQNEMVKYGYHVQGAMCIDAVDILEGNRIKTVINLCVETKYPHNVAIYKIDEFALEAGHMKYKQLLLDLKTARETEIYPDFGIQEIGLPRWAS